MFCLILVAMGGGVQKRVSDPLELLLGMVMRHHVGPKNQVQVFFEGNKCS